jgi:hypothetical protein
MAFDKTGLDPTGSASRGNMARGSYTTTTDNKAAVKGAGYFNAAANELARTRIIDIECTDAVFPAKVTISAGVVTLTAVDAFV